MEREQAAAFLPSQRFRITLRHDMLEPVPDCRVADRLGMLLAQVECAFPCAAADVGRDWYQRVDRIGRQVVRHGGTPSTGCVGMVMRTRTR